MAYDGDTIKGYVGNETEEEWEHQRDLERLARLRVMDDDFMRCVFRDQIELAQDVLRILTGLDDIVLTRFETQRDLKRLVGARSVELDVWGVDGKGRWHDMEVQRGDHPDARRARYHSAGMDVEALGARVRFDLLPEQWVIFVMEEDPFGEGQSHYLFERMQTDGDLGLCDGTHILYVNGAYRGDDALGQLMADFCQSDPAHIRHPRLRERVEYCKSNPKEVGEMCEILEQMRQEAMEKGMAKGIEKGTERTLLNDVRSLMETLGLSAQQALAALRVPEADRSRYLSLLDASA